MAVTAAAGDFAGAAIDAQITALNAKITANGSGDYAAKQLVPELQRKLAQLQFEAVQHYLSKGRISAATILSTLS